MTAARSQAFTLMEVLAALFLTSITIAAAIGFYVNLSNASRYATVTMRDELRATAVLDSIVRDLRSVTLMVKPAEVDPLDFPWIFMAEAQYADEGSDRIKFMTRNHRPRASAYHASDLVTLAYFSVARDEGYAIYRWLLPALPMQLDPSFPDPDDKRSLLLAEGVDSFSLRFLDEDGEWVDDWDSSTLARSSELPREVEIRLSLLPGDVDENTPEERGPSRVHVLRVVLPLPPLDLQAMIAAAGEGNQTGSSDPKADERNDSDSNQTAISVGDCIRRNMEACDSTFGEMLCSSLAAESLPLSDVGIDIPESWQCR